jgi:GNAT superfamily N-acetyltransferase
VIAVKPIAAGEEWAMLRLARHMHAESPQYKDHPFVDERLLVWVKMCLEHEDWFCAIAWKDYDPIGFVAVGAMEMIFSKDKTVDDLGLFVHPRHRGSTAALRLVRVMESWAKDKATKIRIGITTGTNQEQTERFLTRLGYQRTGVLLTKAI